MEDFSHIFNIGRDIPSDANGRLARWLKSRAAAIAFRR
jgi:hypothetical protein